METSEGATPSTPPSSFAPLPKKERSKLKKKLIYNVDDWKEPNSFSPKKAFFFISSSSSDDELTNFAAAAPTQRHSKNTYTPLSRTESDSSLPGLVTPKPSPPPDFFSRPSSPLINVEKKDLVAPTSDVSTLPKTFSSSAYITLKPKARKPLTNNDDHEYHNHHETIYKTSTTTRRLSTPTAIITSHRQTRTKTIIEPR